MATRSSLNKYHDVEVFVRGCSGKVPYFTQGEARDKMRKFKIHRKGKPRLYFCDKNPQLDKHWHITIKGKAGVYRGIGV